MMSFFFKTHENSEPGVLWYTPWWFEYILYIRKNQKCEVLPHALYTKQTNKQKSKS